MRDDYRLQPAPRRLRRRGNRIITAVMVPIALVLLFVIANIEGARFGVAAWLGLAVVVTVALGVARITYVRLSPDDREVLRRASHRVLEPLPVSDAVDIVLAPNKRQQRRSASELPPVIAVTADELVVPGWLMHVPPRRVAPDEQVRLPWRNITRFRVCSDSDGPDLYHVTVRADGGRDPVWRIRRHEITDEIELLDAVRGVGQLRIDLEADVARPPRRDRG